MQEARGVRSGEGINFDSQYTSCKGPAIYCRTFNHGGPLGDTTV